MQFWFVGVVSNIWVYQNLKQLTTNFYAVTSSCICSWCMDIYLVFSEFPFSPICWERAWKFSLFSFEICKFSSTESATSAQNRSWRVPFNFEPSSQAWTVLIAYSKAKFKSTTTKHLSYWSNYASFCPVNFLFIELFVGAVWFRALKCFALQGPFCKAGQTWIRKKKLYCVTCKDFFKIRFAFDLSPTWIWAE